MKKLAIILAGLLACASAFAKPAYNGDLQVHVGVGFDSFAFSYTDEVFPITGGAEAILFNLDAQSWNLFELNDLISVGFMVGTDFGWGGATRVTGLGYSSTNSSNCKDAFHWNIIAAPAIAFSFKPVKIQCSLGFAVGLLPGFGTEFQGFKSYTSFPVTFGVVTEVQAKFFPDKKFSPLVGYRIQWTGASRVSLYDRDSKEQESYSTNNGYFSSGVLYLGASLNW